MSVLDLVMAGDFIMLSYREQIYRFIPSLKADCRLLTYLRYMLIVWTIVSFGRSKNSPFAIVVFLHALIYMMVIILVLILWTICYKQRNLMLILVLASPCLFFLMPATEPTRLTWTLGTLSGMFVILFVWHYRHHDTVLDVAGMI
jgi:hypothetical protein